MEPLAERIVSEHGAHLHRNPETRETDSNIGGSATFPDRQRITGHQIAPFGRDEVNQALANRDDGFCHADGRTLATGGSASRRTLLTWRNCSSLVSIMERWLISSTSTTARKVTVLSSWV